MQQQGAEERLSSPFTMYKGNVEGRFKNDKN